MSERCKRHRMYRGVRRPAAWLRSKYSDCTCHDVYKAVRATRPTESQLESIRKRAARLPSGNQGAADRAALLLELDAVRAERDAARFRLDQLDDRPDA
jgi:hypothetical protein